MAGKRRSQPSSDAAGPSRPQKSRKLTHRILKKAIVLARRELKVTRKQNGELHKMIDELKAKVNQLEEKSYQCTIDANQTSEPVDHDRYELRILGTVKKRVYTGSKVQGQNGKLLKVAIYHNDEKITSGPLASAKFEVLVVQAHFCTSGQESWSAEKFQGSLAKARKEVGSILTGTCTSEFANGEAVLDGLIFKDNSSWAVEREWRLGIKVLESGGVRVLEAISEPFRVLDRHGKAFEKLHPPLLKDGVEFLEKVGNKRALSLKKNKISTVKKFLRLYHKNPTRLLKILGIKSEFHESWKTMISHAKECDAGPDLCSYQKKNTVLFFNSVYEVVGAEFGNQYISFDKLPDSKKILVNKRKKGFYKSIKKFAADFKMLNQHPMPIEYSYTGNSVDDDASQSVPKAPLCVESCLLEEKNFVDVFSFSSDDLLPDIGTDADRTAPKSRLDKKVIVPPLYGGLVVDVYSSFEDDEYRTDPKFEPDHDTSQPYTPIQDGALNQVMEQEGSSVFLDPTPEPNSKSVLVNSELNDDSSSWENLASRCAFESTLSPGTEAAYAQWMTEITEIPSQFAFKRRVYSSQVLATSERQRLAK